MGVLAALPAGHCLWLAPWVAALYHQPALMPALRLAGLVLFAQAALNAAVALGLRCFATQMRPMVAATALARLLVLPAVLDGASVGLVALVGGAGLGAVALPPPPQRRADHLQPGRLSVTFRSIVPGGPPHGSPAALGRDTGGQARARKIPMSTPFGSRSGRRAGWMAARGRVEAIPLRHPPHPKSHHPGSSGIKAGVRMSGKNPGADSP